MNRSVYITAFLLFSSSAAAQTSEEVQKNVERLRKSKVCLGCNFGNFDFTSLNDTSFLKGAKFIRGKFQGANFAGLDLEGTQFGSSDIKDTNFDGVNLKKADLRQAKFVNTSFKNANLQAALINGTQFFNGNFKSADMEGASIREAVFQESDLSWTNMANTQIENSLVIRSDMFSANLRKSAITGSDIAATRVDGTIVTDAVFSFVRFPATNTSTFLTDDLLDLYEAMTTTRSMNQLPEKELNEIGKVFLDYNRKLGINIESPDEYIASFTRLREPIEFNSSIIMPLFKQANALRHIGGHGANPIIQGFAETIKNLNPAASSLMLRQSRLQPPSLQEGQLSQRVSDSFQISGATFARLRSDPGMRIADVAKRKDSFYREVVQWTVSIGDGKKSAAVGIAVGRDPTTKKWTVGIVDETSKSKEWNFGGKKVGEIDFNFKFDTKANDVNDMEGTFYTAKFEGGDKAQAGAGVVFDSKGEFRGVTTSIGAAASTGPSFGLSVAVSKVNITKLGGDEETKPKDEPAPENSKPEEEKPTGTDPDEPTPGGGTTPSDNAAQNVGMPRFGDDAVDSEILALILPQVLGNLNCNTQLNQACKAFVDATVRDSTGYALPALCLTSDACLNPKDISSQEKVNVFSEWKKITTSLPTQTGDSFQPGTSPTTRRVPQLCATSDVCVREPSLNIPLPLAGERGGRPGGAVQPGRF